MSELGSLYSAASITPRSRAGTISPPGRVTTLIPMALKTSADMPPARNFSPLNAFTIFHGALEPAQGLGGLAVGGEGHHIHLQLFLEQLVVQFVPPAR